jgi:hypothetical protein
MGLSRCLLERIHGLKRGFTVFGDINIYLNGHAVA